MRTLEPDAPPPSALTASTVVTPDGLRADATVVIDDGVVVDVVAARGAVPERVLAPGFVDLQVNGVGTVDVAGAPHSDWEALDEALLAQGVTTWCPTLVSAPFDALDASLAGVTRAAARPPGGRPDIAGAHLEGPFLAVAGAHRPPFVRGTVDAAGRAWLDALGPIVRVCTIAPEVPGALEAVAALSGRGVVVSLGHSACSAEIAAEAAAAGARLVTHLGNAMGPLHHRAPGLLGAALTDDRLTVSVIADLIHTHASFVRLVFRAKGPAAVALVTDAVSTRTPTAAPVDDGAPGPPRLADGTLAGSVLTMPEALHNVTARCGVSLADAVRAASTTPAALLELHDRGAIAPGRRADLVALEPGPGAWRVATTWVAGVQSWPRPPRSPRPAREGRR